MQSDLVLKSELLHRVPLSDATIWRLEKAGKFPTRIHITPKRVAWSRDEVEAWIVARMAARKTAAA